jgi:hypothetical protein
MIPAAVFVIAPQLIFSAADSVPEFNVVPMCRTISQEHNLSSLNRDEKSALADCLKSELKLHNELAEKWSTFSAAEKTSCTIDASNGGVASYTELLTCLEMAHDAKKLASEDPVTAPMLSTAGRKSDSAGEGVPMLNVEPLCAAIAREHNMTGLNRDPKKARDDCIESEHQLWAELVKKWPLFPRADKLSCGREVMQGSGVESYTELLECLEMAEAVKKLEANTHDR